MATDHNALPNSEETNSTPNDSSESISQILKEAHERFGIDLEAKEIIRRTLEANGFTMLELAEPNNLPTFEEWLEQRMAQGYSGYNYGCFVINEAGQIGFAKVHYGPQNTQTLIGENGEAVQFEVGGPEREQEVLEALAANGYEVPEIRGYNPASPEGTPLDKKMYQMLVIEAVMPEYGAVRQREDWTSQLARIAAQKIATFNKPAAEIPLFANESIPLPVKDLIDMLPRIDDTYEEVLAQTLKAYDPHIDTPIVVHGDTWFNNTLARYDESDIMFVDWELAGPGYQGQDAGRKLWDLTLKNDWSFGEYGKAADAFANEWGKTKDDRNSLEFGILYESLRWISERVRDMKKEGISKEDHDEIEKQIPQIKAHALMILEKLSQGQ